MEFLVILIHLISVWGHTSDFSFLSLGKSDPFPHSVFQYSCGDIDMTWLWGICVCGVKLIYPYMGGLEKFYYCCTPPSVKCKKTFYGVKCPEGEVLEIVHFYDVDVDKFEVDGTVPCNGLCFNDYKTSQNITDFSHYTCPDQ